MSSAVVDRLCSRSSAVVEVERNITLPRCRLRYLAWLGLLSIIFCVAYYFVQFKHVAPRRLPTDLDQQRFAQLMETWPANKPKAAIYFLAEVDQLTYFERALRSLDKYFNTEFQYPVIVFHENMDKSTMERIRTFTKSLLYFQRVLMDLPTHRVIEHLVPQKDYCDKRPISYRHMCRFNAIKVYEQPILQQLEFYWRLDTDSRLLFPIGYDVFAKMKSLGKVYGYIQVMKDNKQCVLGLWSAARRYCEHENIQPHFFDKKPDATMYYNNFEISRVDFWRSAPVQKYLTHIDGLSGIYYLRWGDAPIKSIAVSIFLPKEKTHCFKDIAYAHHNSVVRTSKMVLNLPEFFYRLFPSLGSEGT